MCRKNSVQSLCMMLLLLYLAACQPQEIALPFETIERADFPHGGEDYEDKEPRLIIITDATELDALGGTVSLDAQAQLQDLDFDRYFVIAVFQGWRPEWPTPQSGVEVQRISRRESTITIHAQFHEPVEGYVRKPVEISPYHLVKVPKGEDMQGEFEFVLNVDGTVVSRQTHSLP